MSLHKPLKIGLFGFGVVGEGIYRVLQQTPTLNAEIKRICIRNPEKLRNAPDELFTTSAEELLNDEDINVIVELINDHSAAYQIVTSALRNGKAVVSANKYMISHHLQELVELQKQFNVPLLYEAAVCGSIPVIRNLEEYYDNDLLHTITGIVNGSTNVILTQMNESGFAYSQALEHAQRSGFAESDPSLDVEGTDAVNKLAILLNHAYGLEVHPTDILHQGITRLTVHDNQYATEKGCVVKLIASARRIGDTAIRAFVLPTLISSDSRFSSVSHENNAVMIGSSLADEQWLIGKGAGRYPTSSAVLSDIAALRYGYRYEYKKQEFGRALTLSEDHYLRIYVGCSGLDSIDATEFAEVDEVLSNRERCYLIGTIQANRLKSAAWFNDPDVAVVFLSEAMHSGRLSVIDSVEIDSSVC